MDLGELGEILGVLLFYLYPEREVESFVTMQHLQKKLRPSPCAFPVLCNVVMHINEAKPKKGEQVCLNDNCTVFMAT